MYDTQRALIVPVLVDITEAEVPPCLRNVSLVDVRRDPNYQHKLMDILTGPCFSYVSVLFAQHICFSSLCFVEFAITVCKSYIVELSFNYPV